MTPKWQGSIVFLGAPDLEATHHFYNYLLGLAMTRDQGRCRIYGVPGGGQLGFCTHITVEHAAKSPIVTLLTPEVELLYQRLKDEGWPVGAPPKVHNEFGIYHFFVEDPHGYTVEIQAFLD